MATTFTETQRSAIRFYLGYPDQYRDINTALESQIGPLAQPTRLSDESAALVISVLASLADVDAKIVDAHKRLKALKVGSINLPGDGEIHALEDEGRRFATRLGSIFGLAPMRDVFAADGASGGAIPLG